VDFAVRFRCDFLELFLIPTTLSSEGTNVQVSSFIKTTCIMLLNKISLEFPGFRYYLAIVCPHSNDSSPHFIKFGTLETSLEGRTCNNQHDVHAYNFESHPSFHWVKSKFQKEHKYAIHPEGQCECV
jgi:hypothetical protein